MQRRCFLQYSSTFLALPVCLPHFSPSLFNSPEMEKALYPSPLFPGATVGIITPSSAIGRTEFEKSLSNIKAMGLQVRLTENLRVKKGFLAGTDEQRLADLHAMFSNPEIDAILCARGGYGSQRLLDRIDYTLIQKNPKIFIGYSDITALHLAIHQQTGLVTFHGPNAGSTYSAFTQAAYTQLLFKNETPYIIQANNELLDEKYQDLAYTISPGKAKGPLIGGNLTLISTLMGTPYQADFKGKIVFLEDIGEAPYRIDRMLTQLLLSGTLEQAAGIVLGIFNDCEVDTEDTDFIDTLSLKEVLSERLGGLGIPVMYGLPFGHISDNAVIPYGIEAKMDTEDYSLTISEKILSPR